MITEAAARRIFDTAIRNQQCADVFNCLISGGTVTVTQEGNIVFVSAEMLKGMLNQDD